MVVREKEPYMEILSGTTIPSSNRMDFSISRNSGLEVSSITSWVAQSRCRRSRQLFFSAKAYYFWIGKVADKLSFDRLKHGIARGDNHLGAREKTDSRA